MISTRRAHSTERDCPGIHCRHDGVAHDRVNLAGHETTHDPRAVIVTVGRNQPRRAYRS
jgi:hypothetical protein